MYRRPTEPLDIFCRKLTIPNLRISHITPLRVFKLYIKCSLRLGIYLALNAIMSKSSVLCCDGPIIFVLVTITFSRRALQWTAMNPPLLSLLLDEDTMT